MNDTSREAFEADYRLNNVNGSFKRYINSKNEVDYSYANDYVNSAWHIWDATWQAAQAEQAKLIAELVESSDALIDRWNSPLWKDLPHTAEYIHKLRNVVDKAKRIA